MISIPPAEAQGSPGGSGTNATTPSASGAPFAPVASASLRRISFGRSGRVNAAVPYYATEKVGGKKTH